MRPHKRDSSFASITTTNTSFSSSSSYSRYEYREDVATERKARRHTNLRRKRRTLSEKHRITETSEKRKTDYGKARAYPASGRSLNERVCVRGCFAPRRGFVTPEK